MIRGSSVQPTLSLSLVKVRHLMLISCLAFQVHFEIVNITLTLKCWLEHSIILLRNWGSWMHASQRAIPLTLDVLFTVGRSGPGTQGPLDRLKGMRHVPDF